MKNNSRYLIVKVLNATTYKLDCFYSQAERKKYLETTTDKMWKSCTFEQLKKLQKAGFKQVV